MVADVVHDVEQRLRVRLLNTPAPQ
jgi:hypothetical protein